MRDDLELVIAQYIDSALVFGQGVVEGDLIGRARLMKQIGIRGAVRGKVVKTTVPDTSAPCPRDKVNRQFRAPAPNLLWDRPFSAIGPRTMGDDFTYVSTWQGFVYATVVIDTFADRIVGWRVSRSAKTDFVLDALEQALHDRRPVQKGGLVHHSDRGGQGGLNRSSQHHDLVPLS